MEIMSVCKKYLGWCPNSHLVTLKNRRGSIPDIVTASTVISRPGSPENNGSGIGNVRYEHTQRGTVIIWSAAAVIATLLVSMYLFGAVWVTVLVLCLMLFMLAIMSHLTVSVKSDIICIRFGPVGLVRKEWPLHTIVSAVVVTNPWYYGYGLRWTPYGPLYNVAGSGAVEVLLLSGETFRIGTDEPDALAAAINRAIR
jgi:hypothetical protein